MSSPVLTVGHNATVADAWRLMRTRRIRHLPVVDAERRLVGMITDHDLRQAILEALGRGAQAPAGLRVNEIMSWGVITLAPDTDLLQAARIMHERSVGAVPVAEGGRVVGLLTATDVIEASLGAPRAPTGAPSRSSKRGRRDRYQRKSNSASSG
jgi:acetoin utilization protein AcuB